MADLSDVQNVLVGVIASTLYPNGTAQASVTGANCKVGVGWPTAAQLNPDLAVGIVNVSVYPVNIERKTTRYLSKWTTVAQSEPTLTLTAAGSTVTVGGTLQTPAVAQNVAVIVGNAGAFSYPVQPNDTLDSIAAALAALIAAQFPGTVSSGPQITVASTLPLTARVGGSTTAALETRRQTRVFRVVVWAPTPALRDATAGAIDSAFAQIDFLTMPDSFAARLLYHSSDVVDMQEIANLYRRDLLYSVEYATTTSQQVATVVAPQLRQTDPTTGALIKLSLP